MYAVSGYFDAGDRAERSVDNILKASLPKLREKLLEALQAVLPIVAIVLVLCFTIAPVSPSILLCFLLGAVLIVVGIMFFTLGAEMSMTPMSERVGAVLTRSRKLPVILGVGFVLPEHKEVFEKIRSRFSKTPVVQESGVTGYDGNIPSSHIGPEACPAFSRNHPYS